MFAMFRFGLSLSLTVLFCISQNLNGSLFLNGNDQAFSSLAQAVQKDIGADSDYLTAPQMFGLHPDGMFTSDSLLFHSSYSKKKYRNGHSVRQNQQSVIDGGGSSYRLMEFSTGIGALLAMFEVTDSLQYIEEALTLAEMIIAKTKMGKEISSNPVRFRDEYRGWVNINPLRRSNGGHHLSEVPLFESYLLKYLIKMSYLIESSAILSSNLDILRRGRIIKTFVEVHGWEKWFVRGERVSRGCFVYLFRNRTHMTAHWATVALYLREMTTHSSKRGQYDEFLFMYNSQLRLNFNLSDKEAYIWNMTWDFRWPYGKGCFDSERKGLIQDVSHGNHVVAYIVESYELKDGFWSTEDIQRLANTVKYHIYDRQENRFYGDLRSKYVPRVAGGIELADGFLKLSRYDKNLFLIFRSVLEEHYSRSPFSLMEPQFVAEFQLAGKYLDR